MKIAVIGFTRSGCRYAKIIEEAMLQRGDSCKAYGKCSCAEFCEVEELTEGLADWTKEQFATQDALVFVGATGIAVRSIAPYVKSKTEDPAVIVMDEQAEFIISLLSGHLGGANKLTEELAAICGAVPVITTATDINGRFSVDTFAKRENLHIDNMKLAKDISAAVLEQKTIGLYSDFEISGQIPLDLSLQKKENLGISISLDETYDPFPKTLHLTPRIAVLGIGCKKGATEEQIQHLVQKALDLNQLSIHSIGKVASIDLKKEEKGLLDFCRDIRAELLTYTKTELQEVEYEGTFSESAFVESITGVGNVCERAALKASGRNRLMQTKMAENGVTVAIAIENFKVKF